MQYRSFCGEKVSVLGYGCMRFPVTADNKIDEPRAAALLEQAYESGVNYYDTAYVYHDEKSESFVGKTILKNHRSDVFVATKCPVWLVNTAKDFDRIFDEQLERLGTDYVDFYLFHSLGENSWQTMKNLDLIPRAKKLKDEGKIRHIGFSFHDSFDLFCEIIDSFDGWEFCQIQLNYINTDYQAGIKGLEYAAAKGLDVIIMEPLLGGRLASPPTQVKKVLGSAKSPVEYALSFLWNRPEISLVLSGMGAEEQVLQNTSYADKAAVGMLKNTELEILRKAKQVFDNNAFVACTACRYCMPCPGGLNIPGIFKLYNRSAWNGKKTAKEEYDKLDTRADSCLNCGECVSHCPQHIQIPAIMQDVLKAFS